MGSPASPRRRERTDTVAHVGLVGRREVTPKFQVAAAGLGIDLVTYSPTRSAQCGSSSSGIDVPDDFLAQSTIITVEFGCEHDTFWTLMDVDRKLRPNSSTIHLAHDPLAARYVFRDCGFEVAEFEEVDRGDDERVQHFGRHHGWPVRLRPPCWGLDGPVAHVVQPCSDLEQVWANSRAQRWLLETWAPLAPHLAVAVARRPTGDQNVLGVQATPAHHCRSRAEAPISTSVRERAVSTTRSIVDGLDSTGVVTVHFICGTDGRLLVDGFTYGPTADSTASCAANAPLFDAHLRAIMDRDFDITTRSEAGGERHARPAGPGVRV